MRCSRFLFFALCLILSSCVEQKVERLPIFGEKQITESDTTYHTIGKFRFLDQDSMVVTNETVEGKIYVADFFFTSCRTICPIMKTQMLRVYEATENDPEVMLMSHTIDPEYDTVALLHDYADRLGVKSNKWHFLTGSKDSIYYLAQTSYFVTAMEAEAEPDGFIHSGAFMLIDKKGRIRGKYDGTKDEEVNKLIKDIEALKKEG
ncbi:MAG TPA: SCO family protein [Chryseosolibacter sp.]